MGLFDFFKRKPAAPLDLPEALIDAVARRDSKALGALCEEHRDEIRRSFPTWRKVPDSVRSDPTALDRYCNGLIAVAQAFQQAGDPSLMALFLGNEADNPMLGWERDLKTAQSHIDNQRPGEAVELLRSVLDRTLGIKGTGVDHYPPRTYGMLGVAYFRAGDAARAVECTEKARTLCEQSGDQEGVAVYKANLQHIREGATVIFRGADGRTLTPEDLHGFTGRVRYEVIGNENVPPEAERLHQEARQAGERGEHERAIALLTQASELAPRWPYPVYDMAYTYLLRKDFAQALHYYRRTVELAPRGFFTAITARDTLEREAQGTLPAGTYLAYLSLEWLDPPTKASLVRQMVERHPHFAPAWKELSLLLNGDERLEAIEKGLGANPDRDTRGLLHLNKAMVLNEQGKREEAVRLLGELALDPESTLATEHLAKSSLAMLPAQR